MFIVQPSTAISPTTAQALERVWAERFGDDAVLLVLEPGMKIGVLAPAKAAAASAQIQEIEAAASALDDFSGK